MFWTDKRGNVALTFAIAAPLLLAVVGGAVDFQVIYQQRTKLQDAADSLATRGAREYLLENSSDAQIEAVVQATAANQYAQTLGAFSLDAVASGGDRSVAVQLTQAPQKGLFLHHLSAFQQPIAVSATAVARGAANVCVVALEDEGNGAIYAAASAALNAPKCSILSNSTSSQGIRATGIAKLTAGLICSAGGASGGAMNFAPMPVTDCPAYEDPLIKRLEPSVGSCNETSLLLGETGGISAAMMDSMTVSVSSIDGATAATLPGYTRYDLSPGVYCGGLHVRSKADVHLAPGVYVFKDGDLVVELGGRLRGEGVGLFFKGAGATFTFEPQSIVHLTAPTSGVMAGMLMMEDRTRTTVDTYSILSSNARTLLGTIYLPNGRLSVRSDKPIADDSAYTAIVSRFVELAGTAQLVLNTNYDLTDVPVPQGVGNTGGVVNLRQ